MPPPTSLPPSIKTIRNPPPLIRDQQTSRPNLQTVSELMSGLTDSTQTPPVIAEKIPGPKLSLAHGLPSLPKRLVERILAGEYIDFTEIPPAKGKVRPLSVPEGNVILVQACDLLQQRRLIPDLGTWCQCFATYAAIVCSQVPERAGDLLGYSSQIARASQKYKWPSWVIYDQNFRQDAADRGVTEWSRLDPSLYTQCFTGQAKSNDSWCRSCHSIDHSTEWCPLNPPPPPKQASKAKPNPSALSGPHTGQFLQGG